MKASEVQILSQTMETLSDTMLKLSAMAQKVVNTPTVLKPVLSELILSRNTIEVILVVS